MPYGRYNTTMPMPVGGGANASAPVGTFIQQLLAMMGGGGAQGMAPDPSGAGDAMSQMLGMTAPDARPPMHPRSGSVIEGGNIDVFNRPRYRQPTGEISTENSVSFQDEDGNEVLVPTIVKGRQVTPAMAMRYYGMTGEHLGKFKTPEVADKYAQALHERQDERYRQPAWFPQPPPSRPPLEAWISAGGY